MSASCIAYASAYVLSLYVFVPAKIRALDRSDPVQIRARLISVSIATLLILLHFLFFTTHYLPPQSILSHLILSYSHILHCVSLFLGPIIAITLSAYKRPDLPFLPSLNREWLYHAGLLNGLTLAKVRDLIVGPLTEEIVFRYCVVQILFATKSYTQMELILIAPTFFGLAHVHHAIRTYRGAPPINLQDAMLKVILPT